MKEPRRNFKSENKEATKQYSGSTESLEEYKSTMLDDETMDEKIERYQRMYEAHDNNYCDSHDIQDLKESYYYKGRRDQCREFKDTKEQDRTLIQKLLYALEVSKKYFIDTAPQGSGFSEEFMTIQSAITKAQLFLNGGTKS